MRLRFYKLFLISALLGPALLVAPALAQSIFVPLNHWAYEFIERMETKGVVSGVLNGTKPYSRDEMVGYLLEIERATDGGSLLTAVEQQQLRFLRFEYGEEVKARTGANGTHYPTRIGRLKQSRIFGRAFPGFLYSNNRNLFSIKADGFQAYIDPVYNQQWLYANPDTLLSTEKEFKRSHGFTLRGFVGTHVGFYFNFRDTKEWGTRNYPDQFDISLQGLGFVNGYGTHIWHDETVAYLVFKLPYMQLMVGKDSNQWGPGFGGALAISNNATSYDQIKLQTKLWRLKFTWFWGFLRSFPRVLLEDGRTNPKNIVAHRLELDVARWLDIGLYETVIFGGRRFEFAYLNPINFYRSAEHFVSDDDNASLGVDFELLVIPHVKLYGEFFVDDLTTTKIGADFHGNKTGLLAGGYWVDALTVNNLDMRLEYVRTRPYLYTHRQDVNTFSHFNTGLGHGIGPNADNLLALVKYRFSKSFFVEASFETFRHGDNPPGLNIGGDITRPEGDNGALSVAFLDGVRESRKSFGLQASYELLRNLFVTLNLSRSTADNMLRSDGSRVPVARTEFFMNLALNR